MTDTAPNANAPQPSDDDLAAVERLKEAFAKLKAEMAKVIVGQHAVLEELLIAIFARGHCLLIGVPGLAKTGPRRNLNWRTPVALSSWITSVPVMSEGIRSGVN